MMKRLLISGLASVMLFPSMGWATDATYVNNGYITFPPQIDATNVINNGTFDFILHVNPIDGSVYGNTTIQPFETSNTRNFTNNGTMIGAVGFRFDNAPSTGLRKPSANFRNRLAGTITAADQPTTLVQIGGVPTQTALLTPSYLEIAATNILNEGVLTAGGAGILRLQGNNVNLSRSGVQIRPIIPRGSRNDVFTNYFTPDVAIYDKYWGQSNQVMNSGNIIQSGGAIVRSPSSAVNYHLEFPFVSISGFESILLQNPYGQFYTNTLGTTNLSLTNITGAVTITNVPLTNIVQAVFVGMPSADNISVDVRFFPSTIALNPFQTVSVGVTMTSTNLVSLSPELSSIYLVDTLASETNRNFYINFTSIYDLRPQNYRLTRVEPVQFTFGFSGNAAFAPDLLYKGNYASQMVTNDYSAYSAFVDNIASRPPNIPAGSITNLPGRIEVFAENLDLYKTRFRADGLLNVNAKHLINSSNAVVDCENLSYNLGSTNGSLKIQSLAQESVARFMGSNYVWSGVWTNQEIQIFPNYETNTTTGFLELKPITNLVEVRIYAMILDATDMLAEVPVVVNALVMHNTNAVGNDILVNDKMTVVQSFLVDGESFTLNGGITFSNTFFVDTSGNTVVVSLEDWVGTNAPSLKYFTNNGTLNIPNEAHFGDDRLIPYATFVNHGTVNAYGQTINSDYAELGGDNVTDAEFALITRSGKVEGGTVASGGDTLFYAGVLKFNQATLQTGTRLDLTVTNSLFDIGGGANNSFTCGDGFRLLVKPPTGDLLGTTFNTIAPSFASVSHAWAGLNLGASIAGFTNNVAIGSLVPTLAGFTGDPSFVFSGTGADNGLYVDLLDLSQLADYAGQIQIDPNLIIYYAAAKLSFIPPGGLTPEEYLDHQFGDRLRWVKDFTGPNSSVDVVINGNQTIQVNKALRNSTVIDSDSDGIPNAYDLTPFDGVQIDSIARNSSPVGYLLTWDAAANTVYRVEYKTNLTAGAWTLLLTTTNTASVTTNISVLDTNVVPVRPQRYYRVTYNPNGP